MKSTREFHNELTLSIRTERGKCAIDMGLDHLNRPERDFIFSSVANTLKGGSAGFGMKTLETGEIIIEITLSGSIPVNPVSEAIKESLPN